MKKITSNFLALIAVAAPAFAQEKEDMSEAFSRVKGASVYDFKMGVDGSAISEEYQLTHITCTDGARTLRVMLPPGMDDNNNVYDMNGAKSTLRKSGDGYTVDFKTGTQIITKNVVLKPVKDPKSHLHEQFEVTLTVGEPLWKAMRTPKQGSAFIMIGTGGTPVDLPLTPKFGAFLKSCGLSPNE